MINDGIHNKMVDIKRRIGLVSGDRPITLVAAAKTQPAGLIQEAIRAGADAVGENRVQELLEKDAQGAYEGAPLHFIGRLQKNKAAKIVGRAELIHSVDSVPLAEVINDLAEQRGLIQSVLLQVNIANEETKGGFLPGDVLVALKTIEALKHVRVRGLMCIPPPGEHVWFDQMRILFEELQEICDMDTLSMGMSGDYEAAVRAGATMVRLGSVLFGERG
ncbi:MAG: YggS family pyridoxal phosphate-dependent enzyme [Oscillospiraceae bacterium]|nr:YggS family pyridoxal phosphate-dependent enzyme [Oscillospiraceae bacterium]